MARGPSVIPGLLAFNARGEPFDPQYLIELATTLGLQIAGWQLTQDRNLTAVLVASQAQWLDLVFKERVNTFILQGRDHCRAYMVGFSRAPVQLFARRADPVEFEDPFPKLQAALDEMELPR
jgi:hypothetical protein